MENKELETVEETTRGPNKNLPLLWLATEVEKVGGLYDFGSRNRTKMIKFLKENDISMDDVKYFRNLPVAREDGEEFSYYKVRQKFRRALENYRGQVQAIIYYKAMSDIIDKQNIAAEESKMEGKNKDLLSDGKITSVISSEVVPTSKI